MFQLLYVGSGWQQDGRSEGPYVNTYANNKVSYGGFTIMNVDKETQVIPQENLNRTSSTSRILKDKYNYREKVGATNYTHSLTTKLFPSHGLVDPIKNIGRPELYKKTVRGNPRYGDFLMPPSPYLPRSLLSSSSRFVHTLLIETL